MWLFAYIHHKNGRETCSSLQGCRRCPALLVHVLACHFHEQVDELLYPNSNRFVYTFKKKDLDTPYFITMVQFIAPTMALYLYSLFNRQFKVSPNFPDIKWFRYFSPM